MDMLLLAKFSFAFVFVIGLMLMMSWFLKRMGLSGGVMAPGGKRRLKIVEFLPLDQRRKLVIVRRDDREHLLVLGPNSETVVESNIPAMTEKTDEKIVELLKGHKSG